MLPGARLLGVGGLRELCGHLLDLPGQVGTVCWMAAVLFDFRNSSCFGFEKKKVLSVNICLVF